MNYTGCASLWKGAGPVQYNVALLAEWVVHAVDSFRISSLILSETSQPMLLEEDCVKIPSKGQVSPLSQRRNCCDGMILDNTHLAHAANRSGGPDICEQIGLCLDGFRANIH